MANNQVSSLKKIVYLGTRALSLERIAEIAAARDLGYEIIMASDYPEVFQSYGFEHNFRVPLGEYDEAKSRITAYLQEHGLEVDGVVGWQDQEEELTSRLTEHLGLVTCSLDANRRARDKAATRELLAELGGSYNPRHEKVHDRSSFDAALRKVGVPCILKPAGNSGGRGIVIIESDEDPAASWQRFCDFNPVEQGGLYAQYRDTALLEEMLQGSEHSISGMVAAGEIYLFAIADKRIEPETRLQYENILPSLLSAELQDEVKAMARQVIAATGINWRGFHIDFMVTQNGIRLLEIGARLGGECINSHLIPLASSRGLQPYHLLLEYVIQGRELPLTDRDYTQDFDRRVASRVIAPPTPGLITQIKGMERVCEHPNTRDFVQIKGVGSQMRPPTEAYEEYKVAYVIAECPLEDNLSTILDDMSGQVEITVS